MTKKRLLGLAGMLGALAIAPMQAQTEVVLYNFAKLAGQSPYAGVIRDSAGNLYGTTSEGGAPKGINGVVYKLDKAGHETVLHSFTGADGAYPEAGLIRDSAGNLYGTTFTGGAANVGVVYELDTGGNQTVLHTFTGGADGGSPYDGVIRDSKGNLYGTASGGGAAGHGVVYELDTGGNQTVLHTFTGGADGGSPYDGVIRDSKGNLYGTTTSGGTSNAGVVYKLDKTGGETVLYTFTGGADGSNPYGGVIRDSAGNFYGTTLYGGTSNEGVVFELDTSGTETVLYTFTGGNDGGRPIAGLIRDSKGDLYGTTLDYGKHGSGVLFEIKP